ncbi:MAG: transposase [Chitinophagia bacterium]|nr:transposase [Chitinophagia bacterium]
MQKARILKKICARIWVAITYYFMKKKWSAKEKSQIVLEGIKGRPVVDICATYGVSQSLYYTWRDKFFANVSDVFEVDKKNGKEQRILRENAKLKQSLAETILELKKIEEGW